MITIDGRPYKRGLSFKEAEAHASYLVKGYEGKRASDKRRIGCFEIKLDKEAVKADNALYQWAKNGG